MDILLLSAAFFQGIGSSLHCIGMCGPLSISFQKEGVAKWKTGLVYSVGRWFSYAMIGLVLGYSGRTVNLASELAGLHMASAFLAFIVLAFFGLSLIFPSLQNKFSLSKYIQKPLLPYFGRMRRLESPYLSNFGIGALSGFLPCGVLYPAYALAFGTGDILFSMGVMSAFFFGTFPALYTFGLGFTSLRSKISPKVLPVFGVLILIFGMTSLYFRTGIGQESPHCHPSAQEK
jgi:sulfite exporter TauE/SafE